MQTNIQLQNMKGYKMHLLQMKLKLSWFINSMNSVTLFYDQEVVFAVYLFNDASTRAGYSARSIFQLSLPDLNLEFSFSSSGCHTNVKENSFPY